MKDILKQGDPEGKVLLVNLHINLKIKKNVVDWDYIYIIVFFKFILII